MGMLDDALDIADSLLGEDEASEKTEADPPPDYLRGDPFEEEESGGAMATNEHENAMDVAPIEFIHFGHVHAATGADFVHGDLDDGLGAAELEEDEVGLATSFRAALQRETLLLDGFVKSTKATLTDYEESQGPLGELAGAAMDMITGDDSPEPPNPAELDLHVTDIGHAGGRANLEEIKWIDLFRAGHDLHRYRADHALYCDNAKSHYIDQEGGGGEGLGGLLPEMPGVSDGIKLVQGILFKAYDVYLAMYLLCREEFEPHIEEACYEFSMSAIRDHHRPVYPIWFPQPPAPDEGGEVEGGAGNVVEEAIEEVNSAVDSAEQAVDDGVDDVKDFMGFEDEPPPAPGRAALDAIFSRLEGDPEGLTQPTAASIFTRAFRDSVGLDSLPEIIETVIARVTAANLGLLKRLLHSMITVRGQMPVDVSAVSQAGREELAETFFSLMGELIPGLGFLNEDQDLVSAGGTGYGGEEISNFGESGMDSLMGSQLGTIAELSSSKLAPILEAARTVAGEEGITMEPVLGRLPMLLTLQFRNTFFPLVDLACNTAFGALAGPMSSAMAPVRGFLTGAKGSVSDAYQDGREAYDTANAVKDGLADGVQAADVASDPEGFLDDLTGGGDGGGGEDEEPPPDPFPGNDRIPEGTGEEILPDEADEAEEMLGEMSIVT
ncbi:MAG: hypothetical protein ABFS86_19645 [Planctomycetota bacterium]